MMQSRTHNCNQLRIENVGEKVKLVGWMENVREVGGNLAFVVLRDFYGTTQVVVEDEADLKVIKGINKESTISVEGTVRERASKNSKQATGEIEVVPEKIEVLGRCRYNSLPFEINRSREADETQRLKYRYLDLRNPAVKKNIILRCQVIAALRQAMMAHDFLEITTPILTASSPEGARDYLVPARKHPGKFYALPQAPQQFKQLLMTSGFDRYFQIAPCFRDEDARGDRSPGEFYQLDMEMSFATQEDVFAICEDVLPPIFAKFGTYDIASQPPFRRIAYNDALAVYGSDKPDLRIDLTATDVTELFAENEFEALRGQTVKAVPITDCKLTRKQIDKLLGDCEVQSGTKSYWFKVDENGELAGGIGKFVAPIKAELTEKGFAAEAVQALDDFLRAGDFSLDTVAARVDDEALTADLRYVIAASEKVAGGRYGIAYAPSLVRGQGYYTGMVFEVTCPQFSGAVAGGGRYDNMVGKFIGQQVPAVGFSIGFERVCGILLEQGYQIPGAKPKMALLYLKDADFAAVLAKAESLRADYDVTVLPQAKKLGKQFGTLEAAGYNAVAFADNDDVKLLGQKAE